MKKFFAILFSLFLLVRFSVVIAQNNQPEELKIMRCVAVEKNEVKVIPEVRMVKPNSELSTTTETNVENKTGVVYPTESVNNKIDQKQTNSSLEINLPENFSLIENEKLNEFYLVYPQFPKYKDSGNKTEDMEDYKIAANIWAKNNPQEIKKIIKEQVKNIKPVTKKKIN